MVGVMGALVIHAGLFCAGSVVQPAEYDIEPGSGGVEVLLMAAPPEADLRQGHQHPQNRQSNLPAASTTEETFALPEPLPAHPPLEPHAASRLSLNETIHPPSFVGDGSSATPGTDPTTFYSRGGGQTEGQPGHLRNPAPAYPLKARRLNQAGVVMLLAHIDASGHPASVDVERSSGFPLLDESALKTVRRWGFRPARIGGMAVESVVEVPIRFVLQNDRG